MKRIILLLVLLFPAFASAHAALDHALPAVGASVKVAPKEVRLWFDDPITLQKCKIEITDAAGNSLADGDLKGDDKDKTALILPIKAAQGKVAVKWTAYCADCKQTTTGSFTFTIKP
jgi:methionine-rich copper-binding protein CopC